MKKCIVITILLMNLFCTNSDENTAMLSATDMKSNELHISIPSKIKTLDPQKAAAVADSKIIKALFEGVITLDPKTLKPLPGIAESWEMTEDNKVCILKIGKDRRWSNGEPILARDIIYSFKRLIAPKDSEYAYMLFCIKNAEKYNRKKVPFEEVGLTEIDSRTVKVTLKASIPHFLKILAHYSCYPVHKSTVEQYEKEGTWNVTPQTVFSGPFKLITSVKDSFYTVEQNELYWDKDQVSLKKIHFYSIEDEKKEADLFTNGRLHVTSVAPLDIRKSKYKKELFISPFLGTYFYRINVDASSIRKDPKKKVFRKKFVRQALSLVIDREYLTGELFTEGLVPAYSFTPPIGEYRSATQIEYNPTKGRELLAKAGYAKGKDFPVIEILYNESKGHEKLARAIAKMWKRELGISTKLVAFPWKEYLQKQKKWDYYISRAGWIGNYPDPMTFLDMFVSRGGGYIIGWSNRKYDRLLRSSTKLSTDEERYKVFQQAEKILLEEMPIIPIYYYTKRYLLSTKVKGWEKNALDYNPYKFVRLEK